MQPSLIKGDVVVDDRGEISFVNDLTFDRIKRFYLIRSHETRFVRAWHGHQIEEKYVVAVAGASLICCIEIDDWESPSKSLPVTKFVLSEKKPGVLHIPAGYANGFMSLTDDASLLFFSTLSLNESMEDDFRFPARHWDPWKVEER